MAVEKTLYAYSQECLLCFWEGRKIIATRRNHAGSNMYWYLLSNSFFVGGYGCHPQVHVTIFLGNHFCPSAEHWPSESAERVGDVCVKTKEFCKGIS